MAFGRPFLYGRNSQLNDSTESTEARDREVDLQLYDSRHAAQATRTADAKSAKHDEDVRKFIAEETSYVQSLRELKAVVVTPLMYASVPILPASDARSLFEGFLEIMSLTEKYLKPLTDVAGRTGPLLAGETVAALLADATPIYSRYVAEYDGVSSRLSLYLEDNKGFREFADAACPLPNGETTPRVQRMHELFTAPLRHWVTYPQRLDELVAVESPDSANLRGALLTIRMANEILDERVDHILYTHEVSQILLVNEGKRCPSITDRTVMRSLIKESPLSYVSVANMPQKWRQHLFLFTDILVYCRKFTATCTNDSMDLVDITLIADGTHSFQVRAPGKTYNMVLANAEAQQAWLAAIRAAQSRLPAKPVVYDPDVQLIGEDEPAPPPPAAITAAPALAPLNVSGPPAARRKASPPPRTLSPKRPAERARSPLGMHAHRSPLASPVGSPAPPGLTEDDLISDLLLAEPAPRKSSSPKRQRPVSLAVPAPVRHNNANATTNGNTSHREKPLFDLYGRSPGLPDTAQLDDSNAWLSPNRVPHALGAVHTLYGPTEEQAREIEEERAQAPQQPARVVFADTGRTFKTVRHAPPPVSPIHQRPPTASTQRLSRTQPLSKTLTATVSQRRESQDITRARDLASSLRKDPTHTVEPVFTLVRMQPRQRANSRLASTTAVPTQS